MNAMTPGSLNYTKGAKIENYDGGTPSQKELPTEIKKEENFCKTEENAEKIVKGLNDSKFYQMNS